jgi:hypothetical protein
MKLRHDPRNQLLKSYLKLKLRAGESDGGGTEDEYIAEHDMPKGKGVASKVC